MIFTKLNPIINKGRTFFAMKGLSKPIGSPTNNPVEIFENQIEFETKESLSKKLKYSISYINKLMKQKKIPFLKNGRSVRFILSCVVAALQKGSSA